MERYRAKGDTSRPQKHGRSDQSSKHTNAVLLRSFHGALSLLSPQNACKKHLQKGAARNLLSLASILSRCWPEDDRRGTSQPLCLLGVVLHARSHTRVSPLSTIYSTTTSPQVQVLLVLSPSPAPPHAVHDAAATPSNPPHPRAQASNQANMLIRFLPPLFLLLINTAEWPVLSDNSSAASSACWRERRSLSRAAPWGAGKWSRRGGGRREEEDEDDDKEQCGC